MKCNKPEEIEPFTVINRKPTLSLGLCIGSKSYNDHYCVCVCVFFSSSVRLAVMMAGPLREYICTTNEKELEIFSQLLFFSAAMRKA